MKPTIGVAEKQPIPEVITIPMMSPQKPLVEARPKWTWCHFWLSLFTSFFCWAPGMICGVSGLYHSILAYVDHKTGDYKRASRKRRVGWGCTITAMVLGALMWCAFIYCMVRFMPHIRHEMQMKHEMQRLHEMNMRKEPWGFNQGRDEGDMWKKMFPHKFGDMKKTGHEKPLANDKKVYGTTPPWPEWMKTQRATAWPTWGPDRK